MYTNVNPTPFRITSTLRTVEELINMLQSLPPQTNIEFANVSIESKCHYKELECQFKVSYPDKEKY